MTTTAVRKPRPTPRYVRRFLELAGLLTIAVPCAFVVAYLLVQVR